MNWSRRLRESGRRENTGPCALPAPHSGGLPTVTVPRQNPPKAGDRTTLVRMLVMMSVVVRATDKRGNNGKGMKANSFAWTLQGLITNTLGRLPHLSRKTLFKHTREAARSLWVWSPRPLE